MTLESVTQIETLLRTAADTVSKVAQEDLSLLQHILVALLLPKGGAVAFEMWTNFSV